MQINQDVKQRWVKDLRANADKQGTGALRRSHRTAQKHDTFCCLGRLCELAVKDKVIPPPRREKSTDESLYAYNNRDDDPHDPYSNTGCLPRDVMDWAGIPEALGDNVRIKIDPSALRPATLQALTKVAGLSYLNIERAWALSELNDAGVPFPVIAEIVDTFL